MLHHLVIYFMPMLALMCIEPAKVKNSPNVPVLVTEQAEPRVYVPWTEPAVDYEPFWAGPRLVGGRQPHVDRFYDSPWYPESASDSAWDRLVREVLGRPSEDVQDRFRLECREAMKTGRLVVLGDWSVAPRELVAA